MSRRLLGTVPSRSASLGDFTCLKVKAKWGERVKRGWRDSAGVLAGKVHLELSDLDGSGCSHGALVGDEATG